MKLASIVALSVAWQTFASIALSASPATVAPKAISEEPSALTSSYAICAVSPIMQMEDGVLHYCEVYEESCDDYPTGGLEVFPESYYDSECESCYHCKCRNTALRQHSSWASFSPLRKKVPIERLPEGLNPNLKEVKSVYCKFKPSAGSEIYFRIFRLVYIDASQPTRSRSFAVGMEMETPATADALPHHQSLIELKDCVALSANAYALKKGNETILLLRAGQPTPASE